MNRIRLAAIALVTGTAVLAAAALGLSRTAVAADADPKAAADASIARGKYLVAIMSCNDCHTPGTLYGAPDAARFLAGSEMGWAGPWGIAYAANLTPDSLTGLGRWSASEISKAIRTGNRPDGRQLSAAMPWLNFSNLTDDDALAIANYLKTLRPVKHAVPRPLKPGEDVTGPVLAFPQPSAWDAPRVKK
jgi:mono/diheme cytochrome c family protein